VPPSPFANPSLCHEVCPGRAEEPSQVNGEGPAEVPSGTYSRVTVWSTYESLYLQACDVGDSILGDARGAALERKRAISPAGFVAHTVPEVLWEICERVLELEEVLNCTARHSTAQHRQGVAREAEGGSAGEVREPSCAARHHIRWGSPAGGCLGRTTGLLGAEK